MHWQSEAVTGPLEFLSKKFVPLLAKDQKGSIFAAAQQERPKRPGGWCGKFFK